MKKIVVMLLSFLLVFSSVSPISVSHAQWSGENEYDSVVVRGQSPLDWSSNDNPLTFDSEERVWVSQPINLPGGIDFEYKFVYDGEWMSGDNLVFAIPQAGAYQFVFHPNDERTVDVRPADEYDGEVTLRVQLPEDTPEWVNVTLGSNLNNFNYRVTPLTRESEGVYEITVEGRAGEELEYRYGLGDSKFVEMIDGNRTATFTEDGSIIEDTVGAWTGIPIASNVRHNFNHDPFIPDENDDVNITVTVEHNGPITDGGIYYTTDGTSPIGARGEAAEGTFTQLHHVLTDESDGRYVSTFEGAIPAQNNQTPVKYIVDVWNENTEGSQFADTNSLTPDGATEFAYYVDDFTSPDWAKDAIVYHIFVDRFRDGDPNNNYDTVDPDEVGLEEALKDWMGGDIQGVIDSLDYLEELGINTIYLSPVFEGPYSHGYHPADFFEVDQNFGDLDLLKDLIADAHGREMRVIYDMVPNHSSDEHPFFQNALENGVDSPYYDWYTFYEDGSYDMFYGVGSLPELNNDNQETRDYMLEEVVPFWLEEVGFDGYRIDYVKGPSYSFWVDFRHAVKQLDEDYYILGEIWDSRDKINSYSGKLDGALDFGFEGTFKRTFAHGGSMQNVSNYLQENAEVYHPEYVMSTFLDNHDVSRFLYEAGNDTSRLMLASFTQFMIPGSPMIYYGTEVGMSQSANHNNYSDWQDRWYREMMPWEEEDQDLELLAHYQQVIALRNEYPALRTGSLEEIYVDDNVIIFEREDDNDRLLIFVNKGGEVTFDLTEFYIASPDVALTSVINGEKIDVTSVEVADQGFDLLKIEGELDKIESEVDYKVFEEGAIRGGAPLSWEEDHPLTYDEQELVWKSEGFELTAGEEIEYKWVMDGAWLPDGMENLHFTPEEAGVYQFVLHATDIRRVDVRLIEGIEDPQDPSDNDEKTEITIRSGEEYVILPNQIVIIEANGKRARIQTPANLPEGTKISAVFLDDDDLGDPKSDSGKALTRAGDVLSVELTYPEGYEDYQGNFELELSYDTNVDWASIYYLSGDTWERQGGERDPDAGVIHLTVSHFSTYGVFEDAAEDVIADLEREIQKLTERLEELERLGKDVTDLEQLVAALRADIEALKANDERLSELIADLIARVEALEAQVAEQEDPENRENEKPTDDDSEGDDESGASTEPSDEEEVDEESKEETDGLPSTATALYNYLFVGALILLAGVGLAIYGSKRKKA
ncbi:glycosidase [Natronobacillus azotifigens]|uniref:Alpha-amylase family glycosyl hydrolase n=1 Tax=Natronobacillus azotifigens TaxID=472978 RepID=A0A9J6RAF9_9BACI|nr:alpha-amylase family glycosyl hydrolase [Natronobacillus azotifigens]MCZ0702307.1 alpha-amylase family glycosyl hydrolase [Natronobacillus azotifigens]